MRRLLALTALFAVACGSRDSEVLQSSMDRPTSSALTADECNFFNVNGTVRICHYTGAAKKPYNVIEVANAACTNGHVGHANDYVATATDPDCSGGGCFPEGAPVDPQIPCCYGLIADSGVCAPLGIEQFTAFDDFSSGALDGSRWNDSQREVTLTNQAALISSKMSRVAASTNYGSSLVMIPPSNGQITTLQADLQVASSTTGDTNARAGIELWFQPLANRIDTANQTNALFARILLSRTGAGGLVATRQLFECTNADCSTSVGIGSSVGTSTWTGAGVAATENTAYTVKISFTASKVFTFTITGPAAFGTHTQVLDAAQGNPPFPVDVSAANFYRARLLTQVRGGAVGGGDGAIVAQFDNVAVGTDFAASASLFDDFNTGILFDPARWSVEGASVKIVPGAGLQFMLAQANTPTTLGVHLATALVPNVSGMMADVVVPQRSMVGPGSISARINVALYNDGSNGSGVAPDVNAPGSQVGDLHANLAITDQHVTYSVSRCESAQCERSTFVKQPTVITTVTPNTKHTLLLQLEGSGRVAFLVDQVPAVLFDPVAAGFAIHGAPNVPYGFQIGLRAGPASPTSAFGPGSSGTMTAIFSNVRSRP